MVARICTTFCDAYLKMQPSLQAPANSIDPGHSGDTAWTALDRRTARHQCGGRGRRPLSLLFFSDLQDPSYSARGHQQTHHRSLSSPNAHPLIPLQDLATKGSHHMYGNLGLQNRIAQSHQSALHSHHHRTQSAPTNRPLPSNSKLESLDSRMLPLAPAMAHITADHSYHSKLYNMLLRHAVDHILSASYGSYPAAPAIPALFAVADCRPGMRFVNHMALCLTQQMCTPAC